jgi:putative toxin-antitoxin system antitoxin component (TIGR02293 family)
MVKAYLSTLKLLGARQTRKPAELNLIEIGTRTIPFAAIDILSKKLGVGQSELLETIGVAPRTALRRKREGYLRPNEADRLLRVARIVEEATRIFGSEVKASRWLNTPHALLDDAAPRTLLASDAGAQQVREKNLLINPAHPHSKRMKILPPEGFQFDWRLLR